jgi:F420-non-reducing hydrogenase small subunit
MAENKKPKFAMYWMGACGGCEIAVLNLHELILDVDANFEIVFWPVAMDAKVKDLKAMPDESIAVCFVNGSVRTAENEEMAHLLRRKSQLLIAFGSCAYEGGIPGLANLYPLSELYETVYQGPTTENPQHLLPQPATDLAEGKITLPDLEPTLKTLDQVVKVDYYLPGCPPESAQIAVVVDLAIRALKGEAQLPPGGAVIGAGESTVCDECPRTRGEKTISAIHRMATFQPDPEQCLLEQGILCAGIATRSGCQALCPKANMPCIGCYGPAPHAVEQGARMMSALASVTEGITEQEVASVLDGLVDPAGTFYRFGLAHSLLGHGKVERRG